MGGNCRRKSSLQLPLTETQIGRTKKKKERQREGRFTTRSILMVMKTPFETRWLRKTRLVTSRLMVVAIENPIVTVTNTQQARSWNNT